MFCTSCCTPSFRIHEARRCINSPGSPKTLSPVIGMAKLRSFVHIKSSCLLVCPYQNIYIYILYVQIDNYIKYMHSLSKSNEYGLVYWFDEKHSIEHMKLPQCRFRGRGLEPHTLTRRLVHNQFVRRIWSPWEKTNALCKCGAQ